MALQISCTFDFHQTDCFYTPENSSKVPVKQVRFQKWAKWKAASKTFEWVLNQFLNGTIRMNKMCSRTPHPPVVDLIMYEGLQWFFSCSNNERGTEPLAGRVFSSVQFVSNLNFFQWRRHSRHCEHNITTQGEPCHQSERNSLITNVAIPSREYWLDEFKEFSQIKIFEKKKKNSGKTKNSPN